jgi:hypothetical protein
MLHVWALLQTSGIYCHALGIGAKSSGFCTPNPNLRKVRSAHTLPTLAQEMPRDVIYHADQPNKATRSLARSWT